MQKVNIVRERIAKGRPSFGPFVFSGSPTVVETFGVGPFHFVLFDTEHTPFASFETVAGLIRAADAVGLISFVRVWENNPVLISKVIELGALGVVVPHVSTREDALRAVEASRFAPRGTRGHCPIVREFDFGLTLDSWDYGKLSGVPESIAWDDREVLVMGLVEEKRAVDNLDAILETELDGVFVGTNDLSFTLGIAEAAGQMFHPAVLRLRDEAVRRCKEHGKPAMCSISSFMENGLSMEAAVRRWVSEGMLVYHVGVDLNFIRARCAQIAQQIKAFAD